MNSTLPIRVLVSGVTLLVVLVGCALSPQVVTLTPAVETAAIPARGANRSLSIEVLDTRASPLVGYRGGVYETSSITTSASLTGNILSALERAFTDLGFDVVEPGFEADIRMKVEIVELSYQAEGNEFVRAVNTGAALRVTSRVGASTFTQTFRDSSRKEVLKAPSEQDNTRLLGTDLGRALAHLVASTELTGDG